jgi:hypothetical protein
MQVMFANRKERAELLEGLVVSNKDATVPVLPQVRLATVSHHPTHPTPSSTWPMRLRIALRLAAVKYSTD